MYFWLNFQEMDDAWCDGQLAKTAVKEMENIQKIHSNLLSSFKLARNRPRRDDILLQNKAISDDLRHIKWLYNLFNNQRGWAVKRYNDHEDFRNFYRSENEYVRVKWSDLLALSDFILPRVSMSVEEMSKDLAAWQATALRITEETEAQLKNHEFLRTRKDWLLQHIENTKDIPRVVERRYNENGECYFDASQGGFLATKVAVNPSVNPAPPMDYSTNPVPSIGLPVPVIVRSRSQMQMDIVKTHQQLQVRDSTSSCLVSVAAADNAEMDDQIDNTNDTAPADDGQSVLKAEEDNPTSVIVPKTKDSSKVKKSKKKSKQKSKKDIDGRQSYTTPSVKSGADSAKEDTGTHKKVEKENPSSARTRGATSVAVKRKETPPSMLVTDEELWHKEQQLLKELRVKLRHTKNENHRALMQQLLNNSVHPSYHDKMRYFLPAGPVGIPEKLLSRLTMNRRPFESVYYRLLWSIALQKAVHPNTLHQNYVAELIESANGCENINDNTLEEVLNIQLSDYDATRAKPDPVGKEDRITLPPSVKLQSVARIPMTTASIKTSSTAPRLSDSAGVRDSVKIDSILQSSAAPMTDSISAAPTAMGNQADCVDQTPYQRQGFQSVGQSGRVLSTDQVVDDPGTPVQDEHPTWTLNWVNRPQSTSGLSTQPVYAPVAPPVNAPVEIPPCNPTVQLMDVTPSEVTSHQQPVAFEPQPGPSVMPTSADSSLAVDPATELYRLHQDNVFDCTNSIEAMATYTPPDADIHKQATDHIKDDPVQIDHDLRNYIAPQVMLPCMRQLLVDNANRRNYMQQFVSTMSRHTIAEVKRKSAEVQMQTMDMTSANLAAVTQCLEDAVAEAEGYQSDITRLHQALKCSETVARGQKEVTDKIDSMLGKWNILVPAKCDSTEIIQHRKQLLIMLDATATSAKDKIQHMKKQLAEQKTTGYEAAHESREEIKQLRSDKDRMLREHQQVKEERDKLLQEVKVLTTTEQHMSTYSRDMEDTAAKLEAKCETLSATVTQLQEERENLFTHEGMNDWPEERFTDVIKHYTGQCPIPEGTLDSSLVPWPQGIPERISVPSPRGCRMLTVKKRTPKYISEEIHEVADTWSQRAYDALFKKDTDTEEAE